MDKKLLIVNYYWPPSGGPAVQRWLSLTTELTKLGWEIWLLTVDEKYATYQMYDQSLVEKIHPAVKVVKTKTIEPFGFYKLLFGKK
ncbi:MAG: glycosyltransferase family 4 protein, partial [Segetibacter sp.]|nr:glycosyltransferase family 4 protein [Segetibacter sp.]